MPRFLKARSSALTASASSLPIRFGSISTTVTFEPKCEKIDANSQPITPPPSTTRRSGT